MWKIIVSYISSVIKKILESLKVIKIKNENWDYEASKLIYNKRQIWE